MIRITIDASAVVAIILNEPTRHKIIKVTTGSEVISPASLTWEVGNALSANLKRNRITLEQALLACQVYDQMKIRVVDVDLQQSLRLAREMNIYAYDAFVLQCAISHNTPLLCLDAQMCRLAKACSIEIIEVIYD